MNGNEMIFEDGTFRNMTAINAVIEDATITGEMIAGRIDGVDINGSKFTSTQQLGFATRSTTIEGGKIVISDGIVNEMVLESGKLTGGRIVGTEFSGVTGEFEGKLIAGGDNRIEIEDGEIKFYSGNTSWH